MPSCRSDLLPFLRDAQYTFDLKAGDTATLAMTALTGGNAGRVAVVASNTSGDDAGFRAIVGQLNDHTYANLRATLVTPSQVDTLAELNAYDAVVIGNNGYDSGDEYGSFASVLRSWVEAGHGVVDTGWGIRNAIQALPPFTVTATSPAADGSRCAARSAS